VGLIDDEAFARELAEHRFGVRHAGRRAVANELASKGVPPRIAEAVLDQEPGSEETRADRLAVARASRMGGLEPQKAYSRLCGLLMRRGYSPEVARRAARRALVIDSCED
jgi:regulatory protein